MQIRHVKRQLRANAADHIDPHTNEVNFTRLVESVVADLDLPEPDETDPIWDWAIEEAEKYEARK